MNVQRIRLIIQFVAFLLLTYGGYLLIDLGTNLPTFSCAYVQSRGGVCFLMPFQHMLGAPFKAFKGWFGINLLISTVTFVLLGILLNKAWCGWVCPIGFIQDLLTRLRKFLRIEQVRFTWTSHDKMKSIKYILLFLMVVLPIGIGNSFFGLPKLSHDLAAPFCQICPARPLLPLFNGDVSQIFIDFSSYTKLVLSFLAMLIFGLLIAGSFMKRRFLCAFCPMSALMSLLENVGLIQLKKTSQRCTKCGNCQRVCDMEIRDVYEGRSTPAKTGGEPPKLPLVAPPFTQKLANLFPGKSKTFSVPQQTYKKEEEEKLVTQDCMLCLKCIEVCPEDKALRATFLKWPIFTSTIKGFLKRQSSTGKNVTTKE